MRTIIKAILYKFDRQLFRHRSELEVVGNRLIQIRQELSKLQSIPLIGSDSINIAWNSHPNAPAVFARYHLHSCDSCSVRFDETIDEASKAYEFSGELLLEELNALHREVL